MYDGNVDVVATLYNVATYDIVTITKIGKSEESSILESVRADYVTLTIKVGQTNVHLFCCCFLNSNFLIICNINIFQSNHAPPLFQKKRTNLFPEEKCINFKNISRENGYIQVKDSKRKM